MSITMIVVVVVVVIMIMVVVAMAVTVIAVAVAVTAVAVTVPALLEDTSICRRIGDPGEILQSRLCVELTKQVITSFISMQLRYSTLRIVQITEDNRTS